MQASTTRPRAPRSSQRSPVAKPPRGKASRRPVAAPSPEAATLPAAPSPEARAAAAPPPRSRSTKHSTHADVALLFAALGRLVTMVRDAARGRAGDIDRGGPFWAVLNLLVAVETMVETWSTVDAQRIARVCSRMTTTAPKSGNPYQPAEHEEQLFALLSAVRDAFGDGPDVPIVRPVYQALTGFVLMCERWGSDAARALFACALEASEAPHIRHNVDRLIAPAVPCTHTYTSRAIAAAPEGARCACGLALAAHDRPAHEADPRAAEVEDLDGYERLIAEEKPLAALLCSALAGDHPDPIAGALEQAAADVRAVEVLLHRASVHGDDPVAFALAGVRQRVLVASELCSRRARLAATKSAAQREQLADARRPVVVAILRAGVVHGAEPYQGSRHTPIAVVPWRDDPAVLAADLTVRVNEARGIAVGIGGAS